MAHNTRDVGWGCGFLDFDNDGWKDLLLVNGHVFPEIDRKQGEIRHEQRRIVYRNLRNRKFDDISLESGPAVLETHSSRGVAIGEIRPRRWVLLKLEGPSSNRSAIGARVRLSAGGETQTDEVRSGSGYISQNDLRLHFGVGQATKIDQVEIQWPSGRKQVVRGLETNRIHVLKEPAAGS